MGRSRHEQKKQRFAKALIAIAPGDVCGYFWGSPVVEDVDRRICSPFDLLGQITNLSMRPGAFDQRHQVRYD
jgi:hypothetical protein